MIEFDSASAITGYSATGSHVLHIEGYSQAKDNPIESPPLSVGGRTWRIRCYPGGVQGFNTAGVVVMIDLDDSIPEPAFADARFLLLDRAGNETPGSSHTQRLYMSRYSFAGDAAGICFMREFVESPDCLVNDCFKIRVDMWVITGSRSEDRGTMLASAALPPPELHRHLGDLLVTGEGADVTFQVAGETFRAHRCVVAARSPVFKAELFGAMRLRQSNAAAAIRVHDMEPQVFNALLHFVYTDSLPPEIEEGDEVAMAQHLLEAADRYVMPRLKLACEEKLCGCLSDACTAATTLVLADQHHCHSLKKACIEFLRSPHVLQAAMETDGFELIRSYPALLKELISKAVTTTEFHYSASAIVGGSVTERHLLHIERYSHAKSLPVDEYFESEPLSVGGRTWRILYHPGGTLLSDANIDHVAFVVVLHDSIPEPAHAETRFLLLDRAGNEMPVHTQTGGMREYMEDDDTTCFSVERKFVEAPECLADDCFKIRLDICVSVGFRTENRNMLGSSSSMPPSDLGQHLGDLLLETKDGADVTFQVADETFRAHRCVVAARSPVLKNELFCAMRWGRRSSTAAEVCIRIHDVAPRVFGALLYFLYTDSLPPEMAGRLAVAEEEEVVTVQRLLEAADRFDMPRLKLTCEEKLCRCLDARTVATTIELAGRHRCRGLEKACVDFLRCPHVLNAVMATYGYGPQLIRNYLSL